MTAFIAGAIFGFSFMGSVFVLFVTRRKERHKTPAVWEEEYYQKPEVVTHVTHKSINRKREIVL